MKRSARKSLHVYAAALAVLALIACAGEAAARSARPARCHMLTEPVAERLFDDWNKALQIKPPDPDKVTETYAPDAILLPTFKDGPLIGRPQIRGYFVHFLEQHPVGRIDTRKVIAPGCNVGAVAGLYTFTVDEGGQRVNKPARYTYVYVYRAGRWLIEHHHSSARPEPGTPK
jgi:uncharacterized protein (TIGR02246 family)